MSSIVANQQKAYVAQCLDAARVLADRLRSVSPAEQFAIQATVTAAIALPVESELLTDDHEDCTQAAAILDGVLARHPSDRWAWHVGSGCYARIHLLPKETIL